MIALVSEAGQAIIITRTGAVFRLNPRNSFRQESFTICCRRPGSNNGQEFTLLDLLANSILVTMLRWIMNDVPSFCFLRSHSDVRSQALVRQYSHDRFAMEWLNAISTGAISLPRFLVTFSIACFDILK